MGFFQNSRVEIVPYTFVSEFSYFSSFCFVLNFDAGQTNLRTTRVLTIIYTTEHTDLYFYGRQFTLSNQKQRIQIVSIYVKGTYVLF